MDKKRGRSSREPKRPMSRSKMMSRIGPKDTKPEMIVRRGLHAQGFRFRLQRKDLPGRPDIVLPRHRVAIFCHGCFWHAHEGCRHFKVPATRVDFWTAKFAANRARDAVTEASSADAGWRVMTVWECALRLDPGECLHIAGAWIHASGSVARISGAAGQVRLHG